MDALVDLPGSEESARTTGRRSARPARVEIITRGERRRSWTVEQKREIVAESLGAELTPTEVARKHAISSGQLYTWRQQLLGVQTALLTRSSPRFAEVELNPASSLPVPADRAAVAVARQSGPSSPTRLEGRAEGLIEVVLAGGVVVRVDGHVDGRALRRVLDALARR